MATVRVAAVDLGATSGRVVAVDFDGERLAAREIRRFPNAPLQLGGLRWDVPRLLADIDGGLRELAVEHRPSSVGVDSWGVDYGLLDRDGVLIEPPYSYRDARTAGAMEAAWAVVPRAEIFARTGVQLLPINTLYQLHASRRSGSPVLDRATTLLCIADLVHHHLAGTRVAEYTLATTTQCLESTEERWSAEILSRLGIPVAIFPEIVPPGTTLGRVRAAIAADGPLRGVPVVAPASHDTASAVAATPLVSPTAAYISSGTWSLIGIELTAPNTSASALDANFTNEGGVGGTYRFLRNVMGLWLFDECRRAWRNDRIAGTGYAELLAAAETATPFSALFDPDEPGLLAPGDMPGRIGAACEAFAGTRPSADPAVVTRTIFEALALRYRWTLDRIARITGVVPTPIHVVGGGARNALLCQITADVCGVPVYAGPIEATSIGNALVQLVAAGRVASPAEGRELVRRSFPLVAYAPRTSGGWDDAYRRFQRALGRDRP